MSVQGTKKYEVIVAGGGPAGVAAAIAAARCGAKTLIIEKDGYFGGMMTGAGLPAFCVFTNGKDTLIQGIGLEILEKLKRETWRSPFYDRKPDRIEGLDWLPIDGEALKRILDEMVTESGCEVLFHTSCIDCRRDKNAVTELRIHNKAGIQSMSADVYIDCTGDADVAAMAGCEMEYGDADGNVQAGTLCFKLANFDTERFLIYAKAVGENGNLEKAVKKAMEHGDFPEGEVKVAGIALPAPGMVSVNFGHAFAMKPLDGASLTRAEMLSRKRLPELMQFIRNYVPGAENAVLAYSGPNIGVRESRRLKGKYCLTVEDYKARADFADAIAYYAYPIDIHAANPGEAEKMECLYQRMRYRPGESYGIPYRCLLPEKVENLLVAGRTISCERAMQASIRVTPACFAMGQAAGTAAAIAVRNRQAVSTVDVKALRSKLRQQGCYLK